MSTAAAPWHARASALERVVGDLIADEVAQLRPGGAVLPPRPWAADLRLDEAGLGLDSLERLSVASALNEALHLHESGLEDLLLVRRTLGEWLQVTAAALQRFDARLTFRTSGSSGDRKPCPHLLAALREEAAVHAQALAGTRRVLSAVPAHHIYGFLFTVLLPECLGGVEVIDLRSRTPQALQRLWRDGDLLVSHPAHWALVARHLPAIPPGVAGVTSTAPCPDELAQALRALGLPQLLQVYGSSETAGIGTRGGAGEPFRLLPFWRREADGEALRRCAPDDAPASVEPPDRLEWLDERHFRVAGRRDDAVQVGGTNVFPSRVRDALMAHPQVADAAVRLMQPQEGARLKAFVVPRPGTDEAALAADLDRRLTQQLTAAERPKAYRFGPRLPRNDLGKVCDWPLEADAADPPA